ncbi:hypothetical protein SKAU_G00232460 [Synaphobranchus kaupii]|uniref:Uncharacterized protein n=1 Tax=Synaphobranchus kaupii TaxID=118154 RepID=A0A9Q1F619_SYNKA|nr:hypothetical protein SKAU_G00232460 [Synaphobranchus kaupii]
MRTERSVGTRGWKSDSFQSMSAIPAQLAYCEFFNRAGRYVWEQTTPGREVNRHERVTAAEQDRGLRIVGCAAEPLKRCLSLTMLCQSPSRVSTGYCFSTGIPQPLWFWHVPQSSDQSPRAKAVCLQHV